MNKYTYLLVVKDNGYGGSYREYFTSNQKLTQEKVNELIRSGSHGAGRIGSNYDDLEKGAKINGIELEKLEVERRLDNVDDIFENIEGNY